MGQSLIDRAAQALYSNVVGDTAMGWEKLSEAGRTPFRRQARTVIEASREATSEMILRGAFQLNEGSGLDVSESDAAQTWTAMIDAALVEEE